MQASSTPDPNEPKPGEPNPPGAPKPAAAVDDEPISGTFRTAPAPSSWLAQFQKNLAFQDYFIALYLVVLLVAVLRAHGPGRDHSLQTVYIDIGCYTAGLLLTRGGILRHGSFANGLVYRMTVFLPVFLSYFQLKWIVPCVSPHSVDADLLAFDMKVFGYEPAVAWDQFVNPRTTEWFSFFYFGYFFLLCAHVLPVMLNASSRFRLAHFALGAFLVICPAHILYMVVPGFGPYHYLAGHFQHPLEGGLFLRLVKATVEAGGSQKDIFPSLHTAIPTFFATYSFIHRRAFPFRFTWPLMAFASSQIIIATMFLRWHYLIDIIVGFSLAVTAAVVSLKIVRWESERRRRLGVLPTFQLLDWPWVEDEDEADRAERQAKENAVSDSKQAREVAAP